MRNVRKDIAGRQIVRFDAFSMANARDTASPNSNRMLPLGCFYSMELKLAVCEPRTIDINGFAPKFLVVRPGSSILAPNCLF
jgi:hypothetical protein